MFVCLRCSQVISLSLTVLLLNLCLYTLNRISTLSAEFLKIWEPSGGQQLYFFLKNKNNFVSCKIKCHSIFQFSKFFFLVEAF